MFGYKSAPTLKETHYKKVMRINKHKNLISKKNITINNKNYRLKKGAK